MKNVFVVGCYDPCVIDAIYNLLPTSTVSVWDEQVDFDFPSSVQVFEDLRFLKGRHFLDHLDTLIACFDVTDEPDSTIVPIYLERFLPLFERIIHETATRLNENGQLLGCAFNRFGPPNIDTAKRYFDILDTSPIHRANRKYFATAPELASLGATIFSREDIGEGIVSACATH